MSISIDGFTSLNWTLINLIAQTDTGTYPTTTDVDPTVATGGSLLYLGLILFGYVFGSYCFQKIYQRLGVPNAWLAWVPIANNWIMFKAGDKSGWWLIALFIPIVNIAGFIVLLMAFVKIFQKLGKTPWLMLLFLIPLINFWVMYHLAFQ